MALVRLCNLCGLSLERSPPPASSQSPPSARSIHHAGTAQVPHQWGKEGGQTPVGFSAVSSVLWSQPSSSHHPGRQPRDAPRRDVHPPPLHTLSFSQAPQAFRSRPVEVDPFEPSGSSSHPPNPPSPPPCRRTRRFRDMRQHGWDDPHENSKNPSLCWTAGSIANRPSEYALLRRDFQGT
ncbi:hypothetical protein GGTG_02062 [Gaeumannomyces tritici R3-111a-1]|uniref:Uncharacterized protein n=1 Tax=Gaeumannomyces tritici (strain R3-111a-1) TaxID=644352 RepID=J3NLB4_GAET3|nr:hypothetical protein GGTG_02062 [Gaeumannomyces tritici R3-111a-1]EJT82088.1 hypothetical protein GGTG_02062 [Gaeumannomyces tritici R3-111a-1]